MNDEGAPAGPCSAVEVASMKPSMVRGSRPNPRGSVASATTSPNVRPSRSTTANTSPSSRISNPCSVAGSPGAVRVRRSTARSVG